MKFALVDGQRQEATKKSKATCIGCGSTVIAKCGEIRAGHWAHQRKFECDPWWEPEGEWHRAWKNYFPDHWQEILLFAEDGEKHIADIKTEEGYVIEFQHSPISPEERRARNDFYRPNVVWVVDGTTRKRDQEQFLSAWDEALPIARNSLVRKVNCAVGALLRDWAGSPAHVFIDFGGDQDLYWIAPGENDFWVNIVCLPRLQFVERHRSAGFDLVVKDFMRHIANPEPPQAVRVFVPPPQLVVRMPSPEEIRRAYARRRRRL